MRLSANNLNKIEKQKVAFEGVKQEYSKDNEPVYRFTAPLYDPENERAVLELVYVDIDEKTRHFKNIKSDEPKETFVFSGDIVEIKQSDLKEKHPAFAYRYAIVDKNRNIRRVIDDYQTIAFSDNNAKMNIISHGQSITVSPKSGVMLDMLKDSGAVLRKDKQGLEADEVFFRNHFLKLGGSIEGLNWLLKNSNVLYPYRYIKTTPDMSMDKTSSHGYWPSNIYQSPDKQALDDFIFELFKRGKGYVADGAYTSQSVQSPMVQHVLKYGKNSPFYNMLKINGDIKLGLLPLDSLDFKQDNFSHIGVRIVNPRGSEGYDRTRPTYIQFYDNRLSSLDQRKDSSKLIDKYDIWPEDHYEITKSDDSVQPLYFEINPSDPNYNAKVGVFKELGNNVLLKDITPDNVGITLQEFLRFPNFEITTFDKASGIVNWDGNNEMIKMNLTNPENSKESTEGMKSARQYIVDAVKYWSENTQADLILRTAKIQNKDKVKEIALANDISKKDYEYILKNLTRMQSLVLVPYIDDQGEVISEYGKPASVYIDEFPLQSIETSEELSAIFAQKEFKQELLDNHTKKEIVNIVDDAIDYVIPQKYKDDPEYRAYVVKTYAPKIIKTLLVGAMNPEAVKSDGSIDIEKLNEITLKYITKKEIATVKEERKAVSDYIKKRIDRDSISNLKEAIEEELIDIDIQDFKLAEAIVIRGKAGLNWRFDAAKDIADLDSVRDGTTTFDKVWYGDGKNPGAQEFWTDITSEIRKYNPSSYVINEITSLWEFYNWQDPKKGEKFSTTLSNVKEFKDKLPDYVEREFLQDSNSTTSSNYSFFFNNLSNYIGCDPEFGRADNYGKKGQLEKLENQLKDFNNFHQPNASMYSHVFWENYDKPRILHILALGENQKMFFMDGDGGRPTLSMVANGPESKEYREKIAIVADENKDYNKMSPKGIAVGITLIQAVKDSKVIPEDKKQDAIEEIKKLALGKTSKNSALNFKRAERFGALPYELTMTDVLKKIDIPESKIQTINDKFCYEMLKDDLELEERLWQTACAMGGTPTVYSGMEYGQTGFETASHNVFQANRGRTLHHRYQGHNGFEKYYDKINAISSLYLEKQLSSLRDGYIISCGIIKPTIPGQTTTLIDDKGKYDYIRNSLSSKVLNDKMTKEEIKEMFVSLKESSEKMEDAEKNEEFKNLAKQAGLEYPENNLQGLKDCLEDVEKYCLASLDSKSRTEIWPIYKYDDKGSKTINVITNNGINGKFEVDYVESIDLNGAKDGCPLADGTKLKRKIYDPEAQKYVDEENATYTVEKGKIVNANGDPIKIEDTSTIFYVPTTKISDSNMLDYKKYYYNMLSSSDKIRKPKQED